MTRPRGDDGSAIVEFVYLAVLLMVPLVYLLVTVFQVQSAAFGATEAARQAARAYVTSETAAQGAARAAAAAELAMGDQGLPLREDGLRVTAPRGLDPGASVTVVVRHDVTLPILGGLFGRVQPTIPVRATHVQVVDRFRERPAR